MSTAIVRIQTPGEQALNLVQREYRDYHPLVALARLAHSDHAKDDPRLEFDCHKTILPYVMPKLASIEVRDTTHDDRRVIVSLFEEQVLPDGRTMEVEIPLVSEVTDVVPLD